MNITKMDIIDIVLLGGTDWGIECLMANGKNICLVPPLLL